MPEIFISYRREDSLSATGRLAEKLVQQFGAAQVFRDLDAIEAGTNFERAILDAVSAASVMLVMIGRTWVDARALDGSRRLQQPDDFVRREIETALTANIPLVPVLVEGASMPAGDALPASLQPFALRQALELSEMRWAYDCSRLTTLLQNAYGIEPVFAHAPVTLATSSASAGPMREVFIPAIANYFPDLLAVLVGPKKLIAKHNFGRNRDFIHAFTFLACSLLLVSLIVLGWWPKQEESLPMMLFAGVFLGTAWTLLLSLPLYAAWRLAGAPNEYRRIAVPLFYQSAVLLLGYFLASTLLIISVLLRDPKLIERVRAIAMEAGAVGEKWTRVFAEILVAFQGPAFIVGFTLYLLINLYLAVWLISAWGAYRQALGLPRWRSALAFLLFALFVCLPLWGLLS
jgi:membrane-bound metal-dependent hydrolase YbcI (DUF457 family)